MKLAIGGVSVAFRLLWRMKLVLAIQVLTVFLGESMQQCATACSASVCSIPVLIAVTRAVSCQLLN